MSKNSLSRTPTQVPSRYLVKPAPLRPRFSEHLETAQFGKGCFWSVGQRFLELEGVNATAARYAGGSQEHPAYCGICATETGHAAVVPVVYNPAKVSYDRLVDRCFEEHKPIRSGPLDRLSKDQYRSVIFTTSAQQLQVSHDSRDRYEARLPNSQRGTTEIAAAPTCCYAQAKHQQYLFGRDRVSRTVAV